MPGQGEPRGKVTISEDVIRQIAETATLEVDGVIRIEKDTGFFRKKNSPGGVVVNMGDSQVEVGISIVLKYGSSIPEISWRVQENVIRAVQKITGKEVVEVNVNISGIDKEEKK